MPYNGPASWQCFVSQGERWDLFKLRLVWKTCKTGEGKDLDQTLHFEIELLCVWNEMHGHISDHVTGASPISRVNISWLVRLRLWQFFLDMKIHQKLSNPSPHKLLLAHTENRGELRMLCITGPLALQVILHSPLHFRAIPFCGNKKKFMLNACTVTTLCASVLLCKPEKKYGRRLNQQIKKDYGAIIDVQSVWLYNIDKCKQMSIVIIVLKCRNIVYVVKEYKISNPL